MSCVALVPSMKLSLKDDFARLAEFSMEQSGAPASQQKDADGVIVAWLEWRRRLPTARRWQIVQSQELQQRIPAMDTKVRDGVAQLCTAAREGQSLRPWSSRTLKQPQFVDGLREDWDIFHFHLGTKVEVDGHVSRSSDLLFAHFDDAAWMMYQIDVLDHRSFSTPHLIEILDSNWPEYWGAMQIHGVQIAANYSDDDIRAGRKAGWGTGVTTRSGRCYAAPGGGINTAGTSSMVYQQLTVLQDVLDSLDAQLRSKREELEPFFQSKHGINWDDVCLTMVSFGTKCQLVEKQSGVAITYLMGEEWAEYELPISLNRDH